MVNQAFGVGACGILHRDRYDPDDLPPAMADGVISFFACSWSGSYECFPIIESKIVLDGEGAISFLMTADQADDIVKALNEALAEARQRAAGLEVFRTTGPDE